MRDPRDYQHRKFRADYLEMLNKRLVEQQIEVLKGIRPAVIGMIFTAAVVVGQTAQVHWASLFIFAASLAAIWKFSLEVVLVIPFAGLIGLFLY